MCFRFAAQNPQTHTHSTHFKQCTLFSKGIVLCTTLFSKGNVRAHSTLHSVLHCAVLLLIRTTLHTSLHHTTHTHTHIFILPAKIRDVLSSANDNRAGAVPLGHLADGVTQRRSAQIGEVLEIAFSLLYCAISTAKKEVSQSNQRLTYNKVTPLSLSLTHTHTSMPF